VRGLAVPLSSEVRNTIPIVQADGALLGVDLGPGSGRVELRYRPPGFVIGAVLTGLTLLALAGAALRRPEPTHA